MIAGLFVVSPVHPHHSVLAFHDLGLLNIMHKTTRFKPTTHMKIAKLSRTHLDDEYLTIAFLFQFKSIHPDEMLREIKGWDQGICRMFAPDR